MPKINIDQLAIEVMQELDAYREDVQEAVEKAVKETAKQTAAELRSISPEGDTGEYAKPHADRASGQPLPAGR